MVVAVVTGANRGIGEQQKEKKVTAASMQWMIGTRTGLLIIGATHFGDVSFVVETRSRMGDKQTHTFHADIYFIVYGLLALVPPTAFFYARWRAKRDFVPPAIFLGFGTAAYTVAGTTGAAQYSAELLGLPQPMRVVAIMLCVVILVPPAIVLAFIFASCYCVEARCMCYPRIPEQMIQRES